MKRIFGQKVLKKTSRKVVLTTTLLTTFMITSSYAFVNWSVGFTSSVDFCTINCHEMIPQFREWRVSSHYDNNTGVVAECSDCHLPPSFLPKIMAKTYYGIRDSFAHYFGDPAHLDRDEMAKSASKGIVDASCRQCHKNLFPSGLPRGGLLAHSRLRDGEKKKCVECHKQMAHRNRNYFGS